MPDLGQEQLTDEQHVQLAAEMYERWQQGAPKSRLEIEYWGNATAHGKAFSGYVKRWLGIETERQSSQSARIAELEALLRVNGISPTEAGDLTEEYRLLAKSRESALAALRVFNDPLSAFRTETFIVLMIIAWNSLLQALLERSSVDYYERDESGAQVIIGGRAKVLETWKLVQLALSADEYRAVRANLDFFLGLRHQISHRYLPALDVAVMGEAQAMLLNFENLLVNRFGGGGGLGRQVGRSTPVERVPKPGVSEFSAEGTSSAPDGRLGLPDEAPIGCRRRRSHEFGVLPADLLRPGRSEQRALS